MRQTEDVVDVIVMGDSETPRQISQRLGFLTVQHANTELFDAIDEVMNQNEDLVQKALNTDKTSGVMNIVDRVMKRINRKGDPVVIKHLIKEKLDNLEKE